MKAFRPFEEFFGYLARSLRARKQRQNRRLAASSARAGTRDGRRRPAGPLGHAKGEPSGASEKGDRARGWPRPSISWAAPGPTATRAWGSVASSSSLRRPAAGPGPGAQGVGCGGAQLLLEGAWGGAGYVGVGEAHGGEARLEGVQHAGADRLFHD